MTEDIKQIQIRNAKVEADKAWETSKTRKSLLAILTYFIAVGVLYLINASNPWLGALVPTVGFLLSTLTLSIIKNFWLKWIYKKNL